MAREIEDYDCMHATHPVCPRCGDVFDLSKHDRALDISYLEGGHSDCMCGGCGKTFVAVTEVRYEYSTAVDASHADDEVWGPSDEEDEEIATS